MEGTTAVYTNPRHYKAGTNEYVEAAAERARHDPNLVECFIAAMTADGWVIRHIPQWLNDQLGLEIGYPRMREWATGARQLPEAVATLMAQKAVPWILAEVGFGGGELPEEVLHALVKRAFPWAAAIDVQGKRAKSLSTDQERWMAAALMPPTPKEAAPVKRAPKKAPRKAKPSNTTAKKAVPKKVAAKKATRKARG